MESRLQPVWARNPPKGGTPYGPHSVPYAKMRIANTKLIPLPLDASINGISGMERLGRSFGAREVWEKLCETNSAAFCLLVE